MKHTVYVGFEVDTESYEAGRAKVQETLKAVDSMLSDTILLHGKEKEYREVIGKGKVVSHVKF